MQSKLAPIKITAAERRDKILRRRADGATFRQIASEEGVSERRIRQIVKEGFDRLLDSNNELARDLLTKSVKHLDDLLEAVWDQAMEGDVRAVTAALAVIDRRTRLLGLDAPTKSESRMQFAGLVAAPAELEQRVQALGLTLEQLRGPEPPVAALPGISETMEVTPP